MPFSDLRHPDALNRPAEPAEDWDPLEAEVVPPQYDGPHEDDDERLQEHNRKFFLANERRIRNEAPALARYLVIFESLVWDYYPDYVEAENDWAELPHSLIFEIPPRPEPTMARTTSGSLTWADPSTLSFGAGASSTVAMIEYDRIPNPTIKSNLPTSLLSAISESRSLVIREIDELVNLIDAVGWPENQDLNQFLPLVQEMSPNANALDYARDTVEMLWRLIGLRSCLKDALGQLG